MNILPKKKSSPITKSNSKSRLLSPKGKIYETHENRQMTPKLENKRLVQKSETEEYADLISNPYDDIKTLIKKNSKLRIILIKTSTSLNGIVLLSNLESKI